MSVNMYAKESSTAFKLNDYSIFNLIYINNYKLLIYIFYVTFILSYIPRSIIANFISLDIQAIIFIVPLIIFVILNLNKNMKTHIAYIIMLIISFQFINILNGSCSLKEFIKFLIYILIPIAMVSIKINEESLKLAIPKFIKIFNGFIYIGLVFSFIDFILGGNLQLKLSFILPNDNALAIVIQNELKYGIYRSHGILGHSLTSALLYLMYFSINLNYLINIKSKTQKSTNKVLIVSILGLILSNSKLGILLGILLILMNFKYIKGGISKITYIFFIAIGFIIFINSSYFENNVLQRFMQVIELGDITNGRLGAFNTFLNQGGRFSALFGRGMGSSDYALLSMGSNNFEMPLFMYMYDYGIISTLLIYYLILIYPICIFIRNKTYDMIGLFMVIFIFANSYNGMGTGNGVFQMFIVFEIIFISISTISKSKRLKVEV